MKIIGILLFVVVLSGLAWAGEPLKMVYSSNGKPLCWGELNEVQGILVEIATQAFQHLGASATHQGYPWVRAQKMVEHGEADAFITIPTPERRQYAEIGTEAVIAMKMVMIVQANSPKLEQLRLVKTAADLNAFRVLSYRGNGWAERFLKNIPVAWATTTELCLKKLAGDRGDVYISDENSERFRIKKLGLEQQLLILPTIFDQRNFYLCMRKTSAYVSQIPKFDQIIQEMKAEGIVQKIIEKFFQLTE